ncbi:chemotaxis protein CheW [Magnetospira sp. QH-2]|uniref:chemotaxis protein CheW n=1 Tax=Magnetospira sp. (strain QH-2) TaxID=1288970 RepID=UPI0003E81364|nr:chemotaxis protein CheW [Magnetospira sp. QH-2]CCQ74059.1 Chemotaxis protein cheA [Magnetospira sp. QH-2]
MDDLLSEFLTETGENLAVLDVELVKFEQDPNDADILGNIFRLVHTIKGTCGFLGLPRLEKVAHAGENVLGKFRDGTLRVTPDAVTLILECIDTIRGMLDVLERTEEEPDGDDSDLIARLNTLAEGQAAIIKATKEKAAAKSVEPVKPEPEIKPEPVFEPETTPEPIVEADGFPVAAELLAEITAAEAAAPPESPVGEKASEDVSTPSVPAITDSSKPKHNPKEVVAKDPGAKDMSLAAQTIRVNVNLLENLMTLVSELVLTRNQLSQMVRGQDDSEFSVPLQRLSHITTDLQEGVMKTRMQPIGNAWAKLPRIVRDLALEMDKKIHLEMRGAETELDRQILELIKDPLTHMVRNSGDHGLEPTAERVALGKPETGTISLNAYHEGGHIIIEIGDDGKGINTDRVREKILHNGLATENDVLAMTEHQIHQFIFRAGFSTAKKVTSVSGRGVGMDVVRTNIEKIGGTIELKSTTGKGSLFTIKIPLTLAIVSALIVACDGERFAIPQISVLELVRASSKSEHAIEMISETPVLRLRNRLLPLVSLGQLLHLNDQEINVDEDAFIIVTQVGAYTFGIIVDKIFDTEEIVVKPVAPILRDIPFYSGNTILGDGGVIMILDPNGIASASGDVDLAAEEERAAEEEKERLSAEQITSLLVFKAGSEEPKAVPLALVARLEEIDLADVEFSHGLPMIQYRGRLMPLVPCAGSHDQGRTGQQPILVFTEQDRSMGLMVDEIVDIVEDQLDIELPSPMPELIGTAVIAGRATDVIDVGYYLTQAFSDWFGSADQEAYKSSDDQSGHRVLLVDDSPFFRNLLTPLLTMAGYSVVSSENADNALKLLGGDHEFDAIVSDIEMPGMDGFEFTRTLRANPRWAEVPVIALSSHATDQDFDHGREAGFTDYVAKFDRDALVRTLNETLSVLAGGDSSRG